MEFLEGKIIKHIYTKDVCFKVTSEIRSWSSTSHAYEVLFVGEWINMGYENSWSLGVTQEFTKPERDLREDWLVCEEPDKKCLRNAKWRRISD